MPGRRPDPRALLGALPPGLRQLVPLLLLLGGVAAGGLWLYDRHATAAAEARAHAVEAGADALARKLGLLFGDTVRAVDTAARDPAVLEVLESGSDPAALENTLRAGIPTALRVRIIRRGQMHPEPEAEPPFTYASLDLLLKAESEDTPPGLELHLIDTADEHLEIARRVPAQGTVIGFLHVSVPARALREELPGELALHGATGAFLSQVMNGAPPLELVRVGTLSEGQGERIVRPVPGTAWQLTLEPNPQRIRVDYLRQVILPMLVILLVGLVVIQVRGRRHQPARPGLEPVLRGAVQQVQAGERGGFAALLSQRARRPRNAALAATAETAAPASDFEATVTMDAADTFAPDATVVAEAAAPDLEFDLFEDAIAPAPAVAPGLFRTYDIRGLAEEGLTPETARLIGRAFGAEAAARDQKIVVVGRDGRHSSPALHEALVQGLREVGRDVMDVGIVPSPVLYFATHYLATRTGVMVTGSHNPPGYNGFKLVLEGETLSGEAIQAIRARIDAREWEELGLGDLQQVEIIPDYIRRVSEDIPMSLADPLRIVVDCGNAVPGLVVPDILRALGHDVVELFCDIDGSFPNHHPDPSQPENLADLIAMVRHEEASLGLAFDGDGDRLGVVDNEGTILWPDRQLMLFADEVLRQHPGTPVVFDVKCSHLLATHIREAGGEPVMTRSGHSLIRHKMQETGALLAGDLSGHLFFKDRWYGFDDAIYAAARLVEILVQSGQTSAELFAGLPAARGTHELRVALPEHRHAEIMARLRAALAFPDGRLTEIDGIRVDFEHGWGLIRPSNTTPCLTVRFEGRDDAALADIEGRFRDLLQRAAPELALPF